MTISNERYALDTLEMRLRMHEQVENGKTESEALLAILPNDGNRSKKLRTWRDRGLWPLPSHEIPQKNTINAHTQTHEVYSDKQLDKPITDTLAHSVTQTNTDDMHTVTHENTPEKHAVIQINTDELREMIQQVVNQTLAGEVKLTGVRPLFKRDNTIARSVRLGSELAERADQKARQDRHISGGTLNGLVEFLLWQHLGSPTDLITKE